MDGMAEKGMVIEKGSITLEQIIESVKSNPAFNQAGDIITFTGVVRETSIESDKIVTGIEIESYEEPAQIELTKLCNELIERHELIDVRMVHFSGIFSVGEILIHCVIASKHRKEGFIALEEMIDEYKHRAYIFKREIYTDGTSEWISKNKPK
ncbi:MAG: molybdenum cofactor biosynthesis protein MoaE [Candidatus Odinarchaeota archaeon]